LQATPNHPILTTDGEKKMGELKVGDKITSPDGIFIVWNKEESAGGMQKVYNIVAAGGSTYIMDGVTVLQKSLKN
jgi:intein/homing endonuclease